MIQANFYECDLALIALGRSEEMGAKLHKSTLNNLEKVLGRYKLNGKPLTLNMLSAMPDSLTGSWRVLWRSIKSNIHPVYRRLFARLAYYDRIAAQIDRINTVQKRISSARQFFQPSLQYWRNKNLSLSSDAVLLLDTALHHVAWLDKELSLKNSSVTLRMVLNLSEPSKRPMRHWFDRILNHAGCDNLLELHQHLTSHGATRLGRNISHDLLRKWCSTQQLMPNAGLQEILKACKADGEDSLDPLMFWVAKLLTFLIEFLVCFTPESIDSKVAQTHIYERLKALRAEFDATQESTCKNLFVV
jgi:hypothetical protein